MKVLVTGGFGYLGSHLVQNLVSLGVKVRVIDNNYFGIPDSKFHKTAQVEYKIKDMRTFCEEDLDEIDAVVHLASISNDPVDSLPDDNIYGPSLIYTEKLALLCKKNQIHLIYPSSCSVYGIQEGAVNEDAELLPQTGYSRNKVEIERLLVSISSSSFNPTILRLATIYGFSPSMRFDTVINMLAGMAIVLGKINLNSNGESWRPFVHIEDVSSVIFSSLQLGQFSGNERSIVNVGRNEDNIRIIDVAQMVISVTSSVSLAVSDSRSAAVNVDSVFFDRKIINGQDKRSYQVNFDALEQSRLFSPQMTLRDGVKKLLNDLSKINLTKTEFRSSKYYRLQHLESLRRKGILDDSLKFIKSE